MENNKNNSTIEKKKVTEKANRLNALYILQVLKNHSSEQNPLSISQITAYVNKEFYHAAHDSTASINASTVTRILDTLQSDVNFGFTDDSISYFNDPSNLGFNIYCVSKGPKNTWKLYQPSEPGEKGATKYYYYESVFSDQELLTLIDSIETFNYFSTEDITDLVAKLLSLRPKSEILQQYHPGYDKRIKDEDSLVLLNIDELSRIIKNQQFARVTYCSYNHQHELIPRKGYPRLIRPLSMMWSNGYYYLVALLNPGYTPANLRIDRITDIESVVPTPQMLKEYDVDFDLSTSFYRIKHPVMHGGKVEHITLLYLDTPDNGMSNAMLDTFGKIAKTRPATTEELDKHLPIGAAHPTTGTWIRADFNATTAGTKLFATQYCHYCKVISPNSLAEEVSKTLETGMYLYKK